MYRGADKSLAWPGSKQATATEDFEFHISYLYGGQILFPTKIYGKQQDKKI